MRVKVTNESAQAGRLLVDDGEHDDRPPRLREIPAGASLELAITQRGHLVAMGFEARVEPVPKRPAKPRRTNRARASRVRIQRRLKSQS
jgi:hypothetical protein